MKRFKSIFVILTVLLILLGNMSYLKAEDSKTNNKKTQLSVGYPFEYTEDDEIGKVSDDPEQEPPDDTDDEEDEALICMEPDEFVALGGKDGDKYEQGEIAHDAHQGFIVSGFSCRFVGLSII